MIAAIQKIICSFLFIVVCVPALSHAQDIQKIIDSLKAAGYNTGNNNINKTDTSHIPDAVFNATVSGTVNQNIEFVLKGNIPNQSFMITGNYASSLKLFRVNINGMPQMVLGFGVIMPDMKSGLYKMNDSPDKLDVGGYTNPQLSENSFVSKSGSLTITKGEMHQSYTGSMDWFIDGRLEISFASSDDVSKKITIKGTFKGVGIKVN